MGDLSSKPRLRGDAAETGHDSPFASTLLGIPALDLTKHVVHKDPHMSAAGGYCDVMIAYISPEHLRLRPMCSTDDKVKVAIKRLRATLRKNEKLVKSLRREINIWSKLDHRNVLPFLGYLLENEFPSLVSEWMEYGTAKRFVEDNPECDVIHLAQGVAEGLKYMHDQELVHSDLKADNILISPSGEPLICDFGISRMLDSARSDFVSTTHDGKPRGTARWMAPELLIPQPGEPKHSKETDVWAYGMTIYELASRSLPYADCYMDAQVVLAIQRGEWPDLSKLHKDHSKLRRICKGCWTVGVRERLTTDKILSILSPSSDITTKSNVSPPRQLPTLPISYAKPGTSTKQPHATRYKQRLSRRAIGYSGVPVQRWYGIGQASTSLSEPPPNVFIEPAPVLLEGRGPEDWSDSVQSNAYAYPAAPAPSFMFAAASPADPTLWPLWAERPPELRLSLKRSCEEEPTEQTGFTAPSRDTASGTPWKRVKTNRENALDSEPYKYQAEVETPGRMTQFYRGALPFDQLVRTSWDGWEGLSIAGGTLMGVPNTGASSSKVANGDDSSFNFTPSLHDRPCLPELMPTPSTDDRELIVDSSRIEPKNDFLN